MENEISSPAFLQIPADRYGRRPSYLRVSITDRCNLSCVYCHGKERTYIPHENILRYEDLLNLAAQFHQLGIKKIRVTGGEPFARKGCIKFLFDLRRKLPALNLCLTSNGTLLAPFLDELALIRPASVNISLDSFNRASYAEITGKDMLKEVLNNIHALLGRGIKVKINAVIMRGITDKQIQDFIYAAKTLPIDLRFIEFMPMGEAGWSGKKFLAADNLLALIGQQVNLTQVTEKRPESAGPAVLYALQNGQGRLGFISALSHSFCGNCNRLRLTSDGKLRGCLFADKEYDLCRGGKLATSQAPAIIRKACLEKPLGCNLLASRGSGGVAKKAMVAIGG